MSGIMDGASPLVWLGAAMGIVGVVLLRRAWALPRRSRQHNGMAWAVLLVGAVAAALGDGAWGLSIIALFTMGTAAVLLGRAAWLSPPDKSRPSNRRVHMLPEGAEPRRIGRRILTFLLAVPVAMIVALMMALALRALTALAGWADADSNVMALFLLPLLWSLLVLFLLLWSGARARAATLLVPALVSSGLIFMGRMA